MNAILTIEQIVERLDEQAVDGIRVVPIILIKPEILSLYENPRYFSQLLEFYDVRTGSIPFFLPGYSHSTPGKLIIDSNLRIMDTQSFYISGLGKVSYSVKHFARFLEELERHNNEYHYCGESELILVKLNPKTETESTSLDFRHMEVYDLSNLYLCGHDVRGGLILVERFLATAFEGIREKRPFDELVQYLSGYYAISTGRI